MKGRFRIRIGTKSFLVYNIIMIGVMLIYAFVSLYYITVQAQKNYLKSVDYECGAITEDFTGLYDEISHMTTFLLSEPDVLSAIQYISKENISSNTTLINRYVNEIRAALSSYYITKYYYRVSYINPNGVFATSSQWISTYSEKEQIRSIIAENFSEPMGKKVEYWGAYSDPWREGEEKQVVGFVKKISGVQRGFFEIEIEKWQFQEMFHKEFPNQTALMATLDGEMIYSGEENQVDFGDLQKELEQMEPGTNTVVHKSAPGGIMLTCREYETDMGNFCIYCAIPQLELVKGMFGIYISIVILMIILTVLTFLFLKIYTRRLVVPINFLKDQMDKTGIKNLDKLAVLADEQNELDEIVALHKGYNRLITRIKEGMVREKKLESLQVQANLDTLQAQINPHFINNTLSVISYRGTLLGDDEICEVCNSLSAMMKFSANTKKRIVTLREELDYVEAYMQLLKYRHQDKFEYRIQVAKELFQQRIPKVVIQQLVENSMSHGYRTPHGRMRIEVKGWIEAGWWYIQVCDNGDGFEESVLAGLREKMEHVRKQILEEHRIQEMEIGGMGIMNIYSRMLLLHNQNFEFKIENTDQGARVVLGSVMEERDD